MKVGSVCAILQNVGSGALQLMALVWDQMNTKQPSVSFRSPVLL